MLSASPPSAVASYAGLHCQTQLQLATKTCHKGQGCSRVFDSIGAVDGSLKHVGNAAGNSNEGKAVRWRRRTWCSAGPLGCSSLSSCLEEI